jgi:hypothetical protein
VNAQTGGTVSQLSLFSADLTPPQLADLGGLMAAHGQLQIAPDGAALSMLFTESWRAEALLRECRVRDVPAAISFPDQTDSPNWADGSVPLTLLQTDRTPMLAAMAMDWTAAPGKIVPAGLAVTAGLLRCWTLAAGRPADIGFLLGLDPLAPDTHEPLAAACAAAGLAGSLLGVRGGGPAVRIVGYRRCSRLAEMIGTPPPEAPPGAFPLLGH